MDDAEVMYLHCEVLVCASSEKNATRCSEGCEQSNPGGRRRKRRDETNQERKEVTSVGPVKVLLERLVVQGPAGGKSYSTAQKSKALSRWVGCAVSHDLCARHRIER